MKANGLRFVAGLALVTVCAPLPASGQYFPPPLIIVPPPAQDYAAPRPAPKPPPDKPKPPNTAPADAPKGHYQGRTFIPDS
ncbi:MAG TPA: hypothetical protein VGG77_03365 [Roseiarcus sp.]|jgi:hypothetical protein